MTSEYGHKLNPHRKLRKEKGIKGIRRTLFNTHVSRTIDQTGILTVRFPDLGKEDVIVPGTLTLNCIRYPALPLVHNGGVPWNPPPRENHFPTGIF